MFTFAIFGCIGSAIATIVTFFCYIRIRMADRTEERGTDPAQQAERLAALDRQERRYLSLHFITLFLFVLFGVLILIHLSDSINSGARYSSTPHSPASFLNLRNHPYPGSPAGPIVPVPGNKPFYRPTYSVVQTSRS